MGRAPASLACRGKRATMFPFVVRFSALKATARFHSAMFEVCCRALMPPLFLQVTGHASCFPPRVRSPGRSQSEGSFGTDRERQEPGEAVYTGRRSRIGISV